MENVYTEIKKRGQNIEYRKRLKILKSYETRWKNLAKVPFES